MDPLPTSHIVALCLMVLYAAMSFVGGLMGYIKARSVPSVATGVPAGILLGLCAWGVTYRPVPAFVGAMIISVLVLGFFGPKLLRNLGSFGQFIRSPAGPRVVAMSAGGIAVIIAAAVALANTPGTTP